MEIWGGDGYAYGIDNGDGVTGIYLPQTHAIACIKYVQLSVSQSYLSKVFFFFLRKDGI